MWYFILIFSNIKILEIKRKDDLQKNSILPKWSSLLFVIVLDVTIIQSLKLCSQAIPEAEQQAKLTSQISFLPALELWVQRLNMECLFLGKEGRRVGRRNI